ncbi:efflux RND transporter permease subunit [Proteinivorax hydrogeniformans]|uniref:Efflux RND transporter permease subunit n=1 Tax=Proteinivorax hydrogeniformans TaxID=1826727 RepID=A0AAU8HRX6_9FIRM
MTIGDIAVKRPVAMVMLMVFVLLLGFVAFTNLHMDLLPKFSPPVLAVITNMPDTAPKEMATLVTEPLESIIGTTAGLKNMSSHSSQQTSLIILEFDWRTNLDTVRDEIKEKIELAPIPTEVNQPIILKFDPTSMPIMDISIIGDEDINKTYDFVENEVIPKLETLDGVASVDVTGLPAPEVHVYPDLYKLEEYNISFEQLAGVIGGNNINLPAHTVLKEDKRLPVRILSEVQTVEDLGEFAVSIAVDDLFEPVLLKDIADVSLYDDISQGISRTNLKPSINLSIQQEGDANLVSVRNTVMAALEDIEFNSFEYVITQDQGELVKISINSVAQSLFIGAVLALLILYVFLRSPVSTLIIALSIPFSIVATFVLMHFAGLTLNLMTFGGLALGVGMLVDNSIVVIENIYRHRQEGKNSIESAKLGANEVASPVIASTFTTMAVFLPVVFVGGFTGELFKELAWTVAFALLASLLVALTVIPMLASKLLKKQTAKTSTKAPSFYGKVLKKVIARPLVLILIILAVFILSVYQFYSIGTEFLPPIDDGMLAVTITTPVGTTLEATDKVVKQAEKIIAQIDNIDVFSSSVGQSGSMFSTRENTNRGRINIRLMPQNTRTKSTSEIIAQLEQSLADIDGSVNVSKQNQMQNMTGGDTIALSLRGATLEEVEKYQQELIDKLKKQEYIGEVTSSLDESKPELQIAVDQEQSTMMGLTAVHIADQVTRKLRGQQISFLRKDGDRIPVMLTLPSEQKDYDSLMDTTMTSIAGFEVPLTSITQIEEKEGPRQIYRENQKMTSSIEGQILNKDLGTVKNNIEEIVQDMDLPSTVTIEFDRAAQLMEEGFGELKTALLLAIALVYIIMAAQLESYLNPFIIILTLPLAFIGVVWALILTSTDFGITAFIGIIILAGIVVNNAIVLVDYISLLRKRGLSKEEAIIEGAQTRFRPIIMTALTTMLAMLPLALKLGEGAELQAPMAIAVMGGLLTSTSLTLFIIPALYKLINRV